MINTNELRSMVAELERREIALQRLAICFDTYLEFARDNRVDTPGGLTEKEATQRLEAAICNVLGLPEETAEHAFPSHHPV